MSTTSKTLDYVYLGLDRGTKGGLYSNDKMLKIASDDRSLEIFKRSKEYKIEHSKRFLKTIKRICRERGLDYDLL